MTCTPIEDTSLREPIAGTFARTYRTNPGNLETVTNITKEINNPYWKVQVVTSAESAEKLEYFVRQLKIQDTDNPDSAYFICDFVDL